MTDFWNSKGKVTSKISGDHKEFSAASYELFNLQHPVYCKLKDLSKDLLVQLDGVSTTLMKMGDCSQNLYNY